jgi:hypothetical protein
MEIASQHIEKLRAHKLFVSDPHHNSGVFPNGVLAGKPVDVPGNYIPDYKTHYALDLTKNLYLHFDAPLLWFYGNHGTWTVAPGEALGLPSDLQNHWKTPEEAVDDILAFFFGDPQRMQAKAADEEARRTSKT